jgi:hypothetical protein
VVGTGALPDDLLGPDCTGSDVRRSDCLVRIVAAGCWGTNRPMSGAAAMRTPRKSNTSLWVSFPSTLRHLAGDVRSSLAALKIRERAAGNKPGGSYL